MNWIWVAIGIAVLAIIVLLVVARGTAKRLGPLQAAATAPELQQDVAALQARLPALQTATEELQTRVQTTQERIEAIKGARGSE